MSSPFPAGTFTPRPGSGRAGRMLLSHARTEAALTLRNGEQLLLTLLIPVALLIGLSMLDVIAMPEPRVNSVTPRIFALAVMSSAFTGQAIALGFDRRYGVLKRMAATALPRWLLVAGRVVAGLVVVGVQLVVLGVVAALLDWAPSGAGVVWAVALVLLGTLSFGALGVLLGGALKAEIVLALANVIWFVLLLAGGILLMPGSLPAGLAEIVSLLPSGALTEGLHTALTSGATPGPQPFLVLAAWGAGAGILAVGTTRMS
ncbi:MAG: multidrug ABC transporter permease [Pseudonocardiaceae bacterium]|nr:multidrug ABC transporter permease [Pseudonocardiaceae bacterium]